MGDPERRQAAIAALVELAGSADYSERAAAGHCLAAFADDPQPAAVLPGLILDDADTWVTLVVAEALCRRQDTTGLRLLAAAIADADDQQLQWIATAVHRVFVVYADERDAALAVCATVTDDQDTAVGQGAPGLLEILTDIAPILDPPIPGPPPTPH